jgi:hypothetical protein
MIFSTALQKSKKDQSKEVKKKIIKTTKAGEVEEAINLNKDKINMTSTKEMKEMISMISTISPDQRNNMRRKTSLKKL